MPVPGRPPRLQRVARTATAGVLLAFSCLTATAGEKVRSAPIQQGNLVGHGGPVKAIAADPSQRRLLTGSFDYAMMLWALDEEGAAREVARFAEHDGPVSAVAFHPDGQRALSASDDGVLHVWDLPSRKKLKAFSGHDARILGLALGPTGRWAATASWDGTIRLWDMKELRSGVVLRGHNGPVNAVAFERGGHRLVSAGNDGTLRLWDLGKGDLIRAAYRHGWGINVLARLGEGNRFAFGALDGTVGIFDAAANEFPRTIIKFEKPVLALAALDKPGLLGVGSGGGQINVYRQGDWKPIANYANPYGPVWAMAFVENGARIYFGGLDDYATRWQLSPREKFESAPSTFPRRFQISGSQISLGEEQFARKCSVCHTLTPDDANRAGPTLFKLFGRPAGSVPGYPYSPALRSAKIVWTPETLGKLFEIGPHTYTPGSKMPLQVIANAEKRKALVEYLKAVTDAEPKAPN